MNRATFYKESQGEGSHLSPAYNQDVLRELLALVSPTKVTTVVDLGSGSGSNIDTLHRAFPKARLITMDLSRSALAEGRSSRPAVAPAQSDAAAIPLATGSVDLIVCTEVLEHVENMASVISEINRVLSPSGNVVISSPNYLNPMGLRKWIKDRQLGDSFWDPWGGHPGFERLMLPSTMRRAIDEWFKVEQIRGAGYLMGWIPLGYRRIGIRNDRYPMMWMGRMPGLRNLAINRYLLLKRRSRGSY